MDHQPLAIDRPQVVDRYSVFDIEPDMTFRASRQRCCCRAINENLFRQVAGALHVEHDALSLCFGDKASHQKFSADDA